MVLEVYTGARPGRPQLLLVVCAGSLAITLALAWLQVRAASALSGEIRIPDTPILVRLPVGWEPDRKNPRRFVLPTQDDERREAFGERALEIQYFEREAFVPVLRRWETEPELRGPGQLVPPLNVSRIGPYGAIEGHRVERRPRERYLREAVTRVTCMPNGDVVRVLYTPLVELRPADYAILRDVCESLRFDGPALGTPVAELLERAGIQVSIDADWRAAGMRFAEVPGLFVSGSDQGLPAWSIAICRSWLAPGRTPRDLLADFAADAWLIGNIEPLYGEADRSDGALVATLRRKPTIRAESPVGAVWVVAQAPDRVAILFVYASDDTIDVADEIAERLARSLEMRTVPEVPPPAAAVEAGRRLVADLHARGPVSRWGREPVQAWYRRDVDNSELLIRRQANERDPSRGYQGREVHRMNRLEFTHQWSVSGAADTYTSSMEFPRQRALVSVRERRRRTDGEVTRDVRLNDQPFDDTRFTPGPGFVPPPVESIIEGWVARGEAPLAIVEVSTTLGRGTHSVLLRQLPGRGARPCVLIQRDYEPFGVIVTFDEDDALPDELETPAFAYRRVR